MIFSKVSLLNFLSTFIAATTFIAIGDHIQEVVSKEQHTRSLRGNGNSSTQQQQYQQQADQQDEPIIPRHTPNFAAEKKLLEHLVSSKHIESNANGIFQKTKGSSCSQHNSNESTCNSNIDEHGNKCNYCTDHLSNKVCVPETSLGYKFAPCNNWVCRGSDPSKSDVTACERM